MAVEREMRNGVKHGNRGENYSRVLELREAAYIRLSLTELPATWYCRLTSLNEEDE